MLTLFIGNNSGWARIFDVVHGKPNYLDLLEEYQLNPNALISILKLFYASKAFTAYIYLL